MTLKKTFHCIPLQKTAMRNTGNATLQKREEEVQNALLLKKSFTLLANVDFFLYLCSGI
jgi:hypothetical protein